MSAASPSPAPPLQTPSPNAQPPSSSTVPPPQQPMTPPLSSTSPPPPSTTSPPKQQPSSPTPSNSTSSPPTASPPPPTRLTPPPTVPLAPPPSQLAPPPSQSPPLSPPPVASPPTSPSRPPPPPSTSPTRGSPPPQSSVPPRSSPPPSTPPSPPSLSAPPPSNPAPPPASPPTENPPPPPAVLPPRRSPPPPPRNSTTTPPPASPPTENPPPPSPVPPPPRNSTSTPPRASPPPPRNSTSTPPRASPPVAVSPQPPSSPPSSIPPPTNSPPSPTMPSSQPAPPSKSTPSFQSAPPPLPRSLLSPPPPLPPQNRSENSSPESGSSGGIGTGAIVGIAVCGGILLLGFIGVALWCLNRQKRRNPPHDGYVMPFTLPSSTESDSSFLKKLSSAPLIKSDSGSDVVYTPSDTGGSGMGHSRNWFSYEELIKATNGFSTQNILGEGGFGFVYKGSLPDGREVAVKQLKHGGGQGEKEFKAEVEIISRIHHRHLVSLVGYCIQDNRRLLVYDYVPNNTLHFHLHGEGQPVLEWANRVKIAAGAARGIAYLHEDCNPRIIHRDIKTSNILLDYNYEAMVADFGLAKLVLDSYTAITTRVMGTFGYVAPEYAQSGKLTEKSDVYSFGVVLLELITGRKAVDESQPSGEDCLVEWARPLLSDALETQKFESLVDPKLEKNYVESEMFCMIQVAAVCVRHSASKRPNMGQVVRAFDGLAASDIMNGMRVGESQALNSTQQAQLRWFQRAAAGSFSNDLFSQESLHT